MEKLRFFWRGEDDLEEGKKYLKPAKEYISPVVEKYKEEYKAQINQFGIQQLVTSFSAARCPAINTLNNTGWITFNADEINRESSTNRGSLGKTLSAYPNSDEYDLLQSGSKWGVNIPTGYVLLSVPTLYNTGDWFSLPGIIDPNHHSYIGYQQLNSFIVLKKGLTIPKNSPIAQWILVKKNEVEVEYDLANEIDQDYKEMKNYYTHLKVNDYEKYRHLRQSGIFKDRD